LTHSASNAQANLSESKRIIGGPWLSSKRLGVKLFCNTKQETKKRSRLPSLERLKKYTRQESTGSDSTLQNADDIAGLKKSPPDSPQNDREWELLKAFRSLSDREQIRLVDLILKQAGNNTKV
jgi:hypothetical protein